MQCAVWSLCLSRWVRKGWRQQSILPGGSIHAGDAPPRGWCVMGRVAVPLALWLLCLPVVQEERCEADIATWCWRITAYRILIFLQACFPLSGRLARSAKLVLAIMVNSLIESQEVSKFHSQRWLSTLIPVCITNLNLWPSGSLRPRLCGVRMTHQPSPGNLWYRCGCCQQRRITSAIASDISPTEISDTCKSYSLMWVSVAQGFLQNTNIIMKPPCGLGSLCFSSYRPIIRLSWSGGVKRGGWNALKGSLKVSGSCEMLLLLWMLTHKAQHSEAAGRFLGNWVPARCKFQSLSECVSEYVVIWAKQVWVLSYFSLWMLIKDLEIPLDWEISLTGIFLITRYSFDTS